jgi:nucleotide-binding universal stress UspA family protein
MKILLAIDGSKFSESALQAVMAQAKPNQTDVRILHVIEPIPQYADGLSWGYGLQSPNVLQEEREQAQALVEKAAGELRDAGFQVETVVEVGDAKAVIVDAAAQWPADLIVLGSHGRKGMERFLMGSVSEGVARHAPCSVQIVRSQARA